MIEEEAEEEQQEKVIGERRCRGRRCGDSGGGEGEAGVQVRPLLRVFNITCCQLEFATDASVRRRTASAPTPCN